MAKFIRINGFRVFFDQWSYDNDELELAEGCIGEQCSECGADIFETGTLYKDEKGGAAVLCDKLAGGCDIHYAVEESA